MPEIIDQILEIITHISIILGILGIIVIITGSLKSFWEYLKNGDRSFQTIRLIFGQHLIIGLDFFLGKDLIDTMLLTGGERFWEDLAGLVVVVILRIALTLMAERELKQLSENKT